LIQRVCERLVAEAESLALVAVMPPANDSASLAPARIHMSYQQAVHFRRNL
jgi:hypothetical protein